MAAMDLVELKKKLTQNPWAIAAWIVVSLIGFATIIRNILSWNGWFNEMVRAASLIDPKTGAVSIKPWFFWLFAALVSCCVIFLALLIRSEINLGNALKIKNERVTTAFKTMQGMMWAATRIRDQHHPAATQVVKSFRNIEVYFRINTDFDGDVVQKWEVYATQHPVHFWSTSVQATSEASPREYLDDINFKVADEGGQGVVYLPTENDARSKKVVIYFLPQIEPGAEPRKVVFSYNWKGLFNQLKSKGSEEFNWTTESVEGIEKIHFSVLLQKATGHELVCDVIGPKHCDAKPMPISNEHDWTGFTYTLENVPAGKVRVGLVLKLKKV